MIKRVLHRRWPSYGGSSDCGVLAGCRRSGTAPASDIPAACLPFDAGDLGCSGCLLARCPRQPPSSAADIAGIVPLLRNIRRLRVLSGGLYGDGAIAPYFRSLTPAQRRILRSSGLFSVFSAAGIGVRGIGLGDWGGGLGCGESLGDGSRSSTPKLRRPWMFPAARSLRRRCGETRRGLSCGRVGC